MAFKLKPFVINNSRKLLHIFAVVFLVYQTLPGTPRNPRPLPQKAYRRRKAGRYSVKNPYCLSIASLRILGILPGFSAFGGSGPRPFVTFGAMPKVTPLTYEAVVKFTAADKVSEFRVGCVSLIKKFAQRAS